MAQVQQNIETWKGKLDKILHEKNAVTDLLEKIEQKTNVRRLYLVIGVAAFLGIYLMVGYGAQFLCNFLGFLYPAYASVKAIESPTKNDDTKWLTYWVVYSCFNMVEFVTDIFLSWVPFYYLLKCVFLVYCMAPTQWNGSVTIYNRIIRPFILKHQAKMDKVLDQTADAAQGLINEASDAASSASSEAIRRNIVDATKLE